MISKVCHISQQEPNLSSINALPHPSGTNAKTEEINSDSLSGKQSSQAQSTLTQVLVFMLDPTSHIILSLHSLTKLLKLIMVINQMINIFHQWTTTLLTAQLSLQMKMQ